MDITEVQKLLAATGYYKNKPNGKIDDETIAGFVVIERTQANQYPSGTNEWGHTRRAYAAAQAILNAWKYEAGTVDGLVGHNTKEAYTAWVYETVHGGKEKVARTRVKGHTRTLDVYQANIPRQRDCRKYYGTPGKTTGTARKQIVQIKLPFKLRIDYSLKQSTNKISVHKKAAPSLKAALIAVHAHYGMDEMHLLGIDRYAGAYNPRKMRGGSSWSMHAYGCAIDFYAAPNSLRVECPQALFCGEEYKPFLDIMERHGWLPAIRLWGKDAMHFQRARL